MFRTAGKREKTSYANLLSYLYQNKQISVEIISLKTNTKCIKSLNYLDCKTCPNRMLWCLVSTIATAPLIINNLYHSHFMLKITLFVPEFLFKKAWHFHNTFTAIVAPYHFVRIEKTFPLIDFIFVLSKDTKPVVL